MMAIINPGDEVVVFEPFYENYGPDAILSGATPRFVKLRPPDWTFDPDELAAAFGPKTKAIILNTPNNPTGKVFERAEFERIRDLCLQAGTPSPSPTKSTSTCSTTARSTSRWPRSTACATAPSRSMRFRKPIASPDGASAGPSPPPEVTAAIRKGARFSYGRGRRAVAGSGSGGACNRRRAITKRSRTNIWSRRDRLLGILTDAGFRCFKPRGAYYIMTDISAFGFPDDVAFAKYLVTEIGVAAVPGSSFYRDPADGRTHLRFTFCKKESTFQAAAERLAKLRQSKRLLATRRIFLRGRCGVEESSSRSDIASESERLQVVRNRHRPVILARDRVAQTIQAARFAMHQKRLPRRRLEAGKPAQQFAPSRVRRKLADLDDLAPAPALLRRGCADTSRRPAARVRRVPSA